jgi:hypothetical protein
VRFNEIIQLAGFRAALARAEQETIDAAAAYLASRTQSNFDLWCRAIWRELGARAVVTALENGFGSVQEKNFLYKPACFSPLTPRKYSLGEPFCLAHLSLPSFINAAFLFCPCLMP